MSDAGHTRREAVFVAAQMGRQPREPWRVGARCVFGHPNVIVSPCTLEGGTPFPNVAWLTCPWLSEKVSALESAGAAAEYARRAASDPELAEALRATDAAVRVARAAESGGEDACAAVGIAGQRDPLGVKCLHAHVALVLIGIEDPIGRELLGKIGTACADERCARLAGGAPDQEDE